MSENFADNVLSHGYSWLRAYDASFLDFSYGVLYGTEVQSNKKDWHILRNIEKKLPPNSVTQPPTKRWSCAFQLDGMQATATVRIGSDWWEYLGGKNCLLEVCVALIRACVSPGPADTTGTRYSIADLATIVAMPPHHADYNVSLLQNSQIPWLFFLMAHFYDDILV